MTKDQLSEGAMGKLGDLESLVKRYASYEDNVEKSTLSSHDKLSAKVDSSMSVIEGLGSRLLMTFAPEKEINNLVDALHKGAKASRDLMVDQKDKDKNIVAAAKTEAALKGFVFPLNRGGPLDEIDPHDLSYEEVDIVLKATKEALIKLANKNIPTKEYASRIQEEIIGIIEKENQFDKEKIGSFKKFVAEGIKTPQDKNLTPDEVQRLKASANDVCGKFTKIFAKNEENITNILVVDKLAKNLDKNSKTTYQEFGKALAANVNAIYKNGSLKTLQDAFKDGGEMHNALNTLAEKERRVKEVQRSLAEFKATSDNLAIKQELLNGATKELEAIHSLQTRLNQLSSNIGAATGNLAGRKAINEFEYSVQQNKEVKQSFFGALVSTIYNSFSRKDPAKLDAARLTLNAVSTKIINDNPKSSSLEELVKPQTIQKPTYDPALPNSKTNQPPPPNFSPPPPPNKKFQQEADQVVNVLRQIDQENLGQETEEKVKPKLSYAEKVGKREKPIKVSRDDLLNDIKKPSERLKPISKDLDMNSGGFTYIPEIGIAKQGDVLSSALQKRRGAIDPEDQIKSLMEGKGEKAQLNLLYSAVINGSKALIQGIIEHGSGKIFTKENCQKLYDAASGVKEKAGSNKKVIIEKGLRSLAKEINLDIQKNTKLDR
jgi:hypothetical protein